MYIDSTDINTSWLAEVRGKVPPNTCPIFIRFNYKIWLLPPQFDAFVLKYKRKKRIYNQILEDERNKFQEKFFGISKDFRQIKKAISVIITAISV